jgi:hypothetical protein
MSRLLACSVILLTLATACGGGEGVPAAQDAGHLGCASINEAFLPVKVLDAQGSPVEGARVTAKNVTSGVMVAGTTNAQGTTTSIGESLGSGTIEVTAQSGSKVSPRGQATFSCGECGCTFDPTSLTLQLPP